MRDMHHVRMICWTVCALFFLMSLFHLDSREIPKCFKLQIWDEVASTKACVWQVQHVVESGSWL